MNTVNGISFGFGFAGLILGAVLTWTMLDGADDSVTSLPSQGNAEELSSSLRELSNQIDRLGLRPSARTSSTRRERKLLASNSETLQPEILKHLKSNEEILTRLADVLDKVAESTTLSRGSIPPLVMPTSTTDPAVLENLKSNSDLDNDLQHFKWTYQRVLDAYGKPSRSNPSPDGRGDKWYYELPSGNEIIFWFIDNHVVRAMVIGDN